MKKRQFPSNSFDRRLLESRSSSNRVSILADDAKASLRAGQVIGTLPRGIEELVRNSIVHGKATIVDIKVGTVNTEDYGRTTLLEVKDNGTGIDPKATEMMIGMQHCSSNIDENNNIHISLKGETLKSLAALSIEFRVTTASKVRHIRNDRMNVGVSNSQFQTFAPSKLHKQRFTSAFSEEEAQNYLKPIICEKVIREGKVVSFKSTRQEKLKPHLATTGVLSDTGTLIQVYGLFHSFAVRKRQYEINSSSTQDISKDRVTLKQVRNCVQILALAFPHVSIRIFNEGISSTSVLEWVNESQSKIKSSYNAAAIPDNSNITQRLIQLCGEEEVTKRSIINVNFTEGRNASRRHKCGAITRSEWMIQGVLCGKKIKMGASEKSTEIVSHRSRRQEYVFINNKISKRGSFLSDHIHSVVSTIGSMRLHSFLLYITCPSSDVETMIDEERSYSYVRQKGRLESFIVEALNATLKGTKAGPTEYCPSSIGSSRLHSGLRLVSTEQISTKSKSLSKPQDNITNDKLLHSPFTSAFMSSTAIDMVTNDAIVIDSMLPEKQENTNCPSKKILELVSNVSAIDDNHVNESYNPDTGMLWTKTRIQALETQIRTLSSNNQLGIKGINNHITKSMLASAEFIAQVDFKFLIIRMNGLLCAIDQHAADERIGLERLEKALMHQISNGHRNGKKTLVHLTKKRDIYLDEMLKCIHFNRTNVIRLSPTNIETIRNHEQIINNWQFTFTLDESERKLNLLSVPGICDKVATSQDFIDFVNDIETRSTDASLVKPGFIRRSLASYACRYAVMFGDLLTQDQCVQLISDLSKCDLCFICAHGRPSVVPLIDLNTIENVQSNGLLQITGNHYKEQKATVPVPLRFRMSKPIQKSQFF